MDNDKADELNRRTDALIAAIQELTEAMRRGAKPGAAKRVDTSDTEITAGEKCGTGHGWTEAVMPFGKHKGRQFADVPVSYFEYLAKSWEPKGFDSDNDFAAAFAALGLRAEEADKGAGEQPAGAKAPDYDGGDVPF